MAELQSATRILLLLVLFTFAKVALASPQSCKQLFVADQPVLEAADFDIKKWFPEVRVFVDDSGDLHFSHASRAFILWRQRSEPQIPDEAFAFHYLTDEQVILMVDRRTRADAGRVAKAGELIWQTLPEVIVNGKEIDFEADWNPFPATSFFWTAKKLRQNLTLKLAGRNSDWSGALKYYYGEDHLTGKSHLIFIDNNSMFHADGAERLKKIMPDFEILVAGSVAVYFERSPKGRIRTSHISVDDKHYIGFKTLTGREALVRLLDGFAKSFPLDKDSKISSSAKNRKLSWPEDVSPNGVSYQTLREKFALP